MDTLCQSAVDNKSQRDPCQHSPLTPEQIRKLAPQAQDFFARNFGGAPGNWTNEQVRTCREFQDAITAIVRETEALHHIGCRQ